MIMLKSLLIIISVFINFEIVFNRKFFKNIQIDFSFLINTVIF